MKRIAVLSMVLSMTTGLAAGEQPTDAPAQYVVDADASWLRVLVFRGGLLGGLGHNHVVSTTHLEGRIEVGTPVSESRIEIDVPLAGLRVDVPELRRAEGERFSGDLSAGDIAATRANMLGPRLLDAAAHPVISLTSTRISGDLPELEVTADLDIKGTTHQLVFAVDVVSADDELIITGARAVTHHQLGLKPFTAAFGTLRVGDELEIRYSIVARREAGAN